MGKKYKVPAIEKANTILQTIIAYPDRTSLSFLLNETEINKSTLYSLLKTMEELDWIKKNEENLYNINYLSPLFAGSYLPRFDLIHIFKKEAKKTVNLVNETVQLAKLEGTNINYLARETTNS